METDCLHVQCSLQEYDDWLSGKMEEDNPLFEIDHFKYSCYIDYKYMKDVFCGSEEVLKVGISRQVKTSKLLLFLLSLSALFILSTGIQTLYT